MSRGEAANGQKRTIKAHPVSALKGLLHSETCRVMTRYSSGQAVIQSVPFSAGCCAALDFLSNVAAKFTHLISLQLLVELPFGQMERRPQPSETRQPMRLAKHWPTG